MPDSPRFRDVVQPGTWIGELRDTDRGFALDICGVLTAAELRAVADLMERALIPKVQEQT